MVNEGFMVRQDVKVSCSTTDAKDYICLPAPDVEYLYKQCVEKEEKPWWKLW